MTHEVSIILVEDIRHAFLPLANDWCLVHAASDGELLAIARGIEAAVTAECAASFGEEVYTDGCDFEEIARLQAAQEWQYADSAADRATDAAYDAGR